jgi:uncharacterized membrane protein
MSKILIISVTILAIVLAIIGGYYTVELAKLMGANLLSIEGVLGCYLVSFLIVFNLWFYMIIKIEKRR